MAFRFIHSADLHIGPSGDIRQMKALERIVQLCREKQADALLLAGDLMDMPLPQGSVIGTVKRLLGECACRVFIAPGNHDPRMPGSAYDGQWPENVHIFGAEYRCVPMPGAEIWGAGFVLPRQESCLMHALPPKQDPALFRVGVLHGELKSENETVYHPIPAAAVQGSGLDYLALGHIHKRSPLQNAGATTYAYSGCPQGRGMDETGPCGVYFGTWQDGSLSLEFVPVAEEIFLRQNLDVSGCEDEMAVFQRLRDFLAPYNERILRAEITLTGTPGQIPPLEELEKQFSFPLLLLDETEPPAAAFAEEATLRGAFVRRMLQRMQEAPESEKESCRLALKLGLAAFAEVAGK